MAGLVSVSVSTNIFHDAQCIALIRLRPLGQQLALVGGGYVLVRFMQQYSSFTGPDPPQVWTEKLNITCFVNQGVWVNMAE